MIKINLPPLIHIFAPFFFLLFTGCMTRVHDYSESFDIYDYYLTENEFHYELTRPVEIGDSLESFTFPLGSYWQYSKFAGYDTPASEYRVTLDSIIDDSTLLFTIRTTPIYVRIDGPAYSAYRYNLTDEWNSFYLREDLPLPHVSELEKKYLHLSIKMDDGSYSYRVGDRIYNSTLGGVGPERCLVDCNGSGEKVVAKMINEFNVKEERWFQ